MPVSPTPDDSYYWEIANAYKEAELEILGQIKARLDKGQALSDQAWATERLAEIQVMRREATKVLAQVNQSQASKISGAFGNAYKDSELAALKDTAAFLPAKPSAVSSDARKRTVAAIARKQNQKIAGVMPGMLRAMEDDYRSVVKSSVARVAAGGVDRRTATSKALQQAFGMGLKTGPGGKMNLPDYITMSMRTGTANAMIQGHLDTLEANGMDLVMIHPGPRHCQRCDAWANVPLYRASGKPGVHLFDSAVSLKKVKVDVKGTLAQAKEAGWGHPNCRCNVGVYIPGVTQTPIPRPPWDEAGYEAQQKQRLGERQIREWKIKELLAGTPGEKAFARKKIGAWQLALRTLIDTHPELKRQPHRESVNGTFGPTYQGPKAPPPKPSTPPKPKPATPAKVKSLEEQLKDVEAELAALKAKVDKIMKDAEDQPGFTDDQLAEFTKINADHKVAIVKKNQLEESIQASKPVDPEPLVMSPIQEWTQGMLKQFPELPAGPVQKLLDSTKSEKVKHVALEDLYKNNWLTFKQYQDGVLTLKNLKTPDPVVPPQKPINKVPDPLKPEQKYVDNLAELLESGAMTEKALLDKANDPSTSALGKLNAETAIAQWKAKHIDVDDGKPTTWEELDEEYGLPGDYLKDYGFDPEQVAYWMENAPEGIKKNIAKAQDEYDVDMLYNALEGSFKVTKQQIEDWKKPKPPKEPSGKPSEAPPVTSEYLAPPRYTWDGKSKPESPPEPALPKNNKTLKLDVWLDKVKAKYEAFAKATNNPKKKLEESNNWNYVQQALAGDTTAIKYLHQNKYLDDGLMQEALDAIADTSKLDPAVERAYKSAMAQYGQDLAQYKLDLAKYRADNGIVSEAKGHLGALRHDSDRAGINWANQHINSPTRTSPQGTALNSYTGSSYSSWNAALRGVRSDELPSGTYKNKTKTLDDAMTPMPEDVIVHRGTTWHEFLSLGDLMPPPPPHSLIGKTYQNDGYASTSVGTIAAFKHKPVQLEILVPKGHKAVNAMKVSQFGDTEREVLMSRGTRYFVHDVYEHRNGHGGEWRVVVEIVGEGEDSTLWTPIPDGGMRRR